MEAKNLSSVVSPAFDIDYIVCRYAMSSSWDMRECEHWIGMLSRKGYYVADRETFFLEVKNRFKSFVEVMFLFFGENIREQ